MDEKTQYSLSITFGTIAELSSFTQQLSAFKRYQERKLHKKENDQRGKHVADLHRRTREFIESNPMHEALTYREAFKIVSTNMKD